MLDRRHEVPGLVLLDVEVGIAGDPERMRLDDLQAGEEDVQVRGDDLLQRDVGVGVHGHEAREDLGNLDTGEALLPAVGSRTTTASDRLSVLMYGNG